MTLALLIVLVAAHLTAVGLATFGPLYCIWLEWRGRREPEAGLLGRTLAAHCIFALVLGGVLGAAQLALLYASGNGSYWNALATIKPSRWWFSGVEYFFSIACYTVYWSAWNRWTARRWLHRLVALIGSTNLAYHFPALFVVVGLVSHRPALWESRVSVPQVLLEQHTLARVGHFLIAAVIFSAVYVIWLALRDNSVSDSRRKLTTLPAWLGLAATLTQFPLGMWIIMQLPPEQRPLLLGGNLWATSALGLAVLLSVLLMHQLAAIALGDADRSAARKAMALVLWVFLSMAATRHLLQPATFSDTGATAHQTRGV